MDTILHYPVLLTFFSNLLKIYVRRIELYLLRSDLLSRELLFDLQDEMWFVSIVTGEYSDLVKHVRLVDRLDTRRDTRCRRYANWVAGS